MNYLEIVGTLVGLLYLWFEYKASIWLWPVSVIMPAISGRAVCRFGYQCLLFAGGYLWLVGMVEACSRQAGEIDYFYSSQVVYAFVCCSMPCVCFDRWDIGNVYRQYNTMVG